MSKHVRVDDFGNVVVVHVLPKKLSDLDHRMIEEIKEDLIGLITNGHPHLILDLSAVEYMASGVKGMLITVHKTARGAGGRLVLCGIHSDIMESFEVTKLNGLFNIVADETAALAEFPDVPEIVIVG